MLGRPSNSHSQVRGLIRSHLCFSDSLPAGTQLAIYTVPSPRGGRYSIVVDDEPPKFFTTNVTSSGPVADLPCAAAVTYSRDNLVLSAHTITLKFEGNPDAPDLATLEFSGVL